MSSARAWTSDPPTTSDAAGPARRLIRRLDAWLRRRQGFVEFSANPACILRVVVGVADCEMRLADGVVVRPGDTILDLHFWNERMPQTSDCPGLGWGGRFGRQLLRSFGDLAVALETDPRLKDAVAVRGRLAFAGERNRDEMRRFGNWFGLETAEEARRLSLLNRLHDAAEDVWLLALAWTFNPGSLHARSVVRRRDDLWVSKQGLVARYSAPKSERKRAAG